MINGRLIAVVGASGVGKDSLINALVRAAPELQPVRRVITRNACADGEDHIAVSEEEFATMRRNGDFSIEWYAHGFSYGIPASALAHVQAGEQCVANLSRGVLQRAASVFPIMTVLNVTAESATLARRLAQRGRESAEEIERRLLRQMSPVPAGLDAFDIANDGPLENTVAASLKALRLQH